MASRPARRGAPARRLTAAALVAASAAALAAALACAKMEAPPGGPPDLTSPHLVATRPESLAVVPRFRGDAGFQFDEVISEGSTESQGLGTSDLERLVILSPTDHQPTVRWHRKRITVRPREGWQPNRVYRVELLPGVTDLKQNRSADHAVITFSTGAEAPTATLRGTVSDWTNATPARDALVEAVHLPDSLPYRAIADSSGSFTLGPIPRGSYLVYGVLDQNRNHRRDPREAFDSVRVSGDSMVADLWTYPHDSLGPRLQTATVADSATAALTFSQPLDPRQRLTPRDVTVRLLPDSSDVAVQSILPPAVHDSIYRPAADTAKARADTAGPAKRGVPRDTTVRPGKLPPAAPQPGRRPLDTRLQLRLRKPLVAGGRYVIDVRGVRNVSGASADGRAVLTVPERPAKAPGDTNAPAKAPADTSARRKAPADTSARRKAPADTGTARRPHR